MPEIRGLIPNHVPNPKIQNPIREIPKNFEGCSRNSSAL
jgi:hypothetical protein